MSADSPTRRRWFQFGLGGLFWLITVLALVAYGCNEHYARMKTQAEVDRLRAEREAESSEVRYMRKFMEGDRLTRIMMLQDMRSRRWEVEAAATQP